MGRSRDGCSVERTRAELCGNVKALHDEREELRKKTLQQRKRLRELKKEGADLRTRLAEADLLRADIAVENVARKCAAETASLELDIAKREKQHLEQELASFRGGAARLRSVREADARRGLERSAWRAECANLERELAAARVKLAALADSVQLQTRSTDFVHQAETLRQELAMQRRQRLDAELSMSAVQQELATLRERRRSLDVESEKAMLEKTRLAEARIRLSQASEARRRQADTLQASLSELDVVREELQRTTAERDRLRAGVQRTLQTLEQIQQYSSEAKAYAASLNPRTSKCEGDRYIGPQNISPVGAW